MRVHLSWVGVLACLIVLAGCGKRASESAAEKVIEAAIEKNAKGKAKVDLSKNKIEIKTDEGEFKMSSGGDVQIPAGFPKDVPLYKGAKATVAMTQPKGFMLNLQTQDAVDKVAAAYASMMTGEGWEQEMSMDMGANKMLHYKKDKRIAHITIAGSDTKNETTISIVTATEN